MILSRYLNAKFADGELYSSVLRLEPNMVMQIPKYVETYLNHKSLSAIGIDEFSSLNFAFFPEVSNVNEQGILVGYGDRKGEFEDGMYSVKPGGIYDGYIPVHVKRSRNLYVLNEQGSTSQGVNVLEHMNSLSVELTKGHNSSILNENTLEQDFLPGNYRLVNYLQVLRKMKSDVLVAGSGSTPPPFGSEICNNGIDDDYDGFVDGDDPDCGGSGSGMSCPEDAHCFRDCQQDINELTGARFRNIDAYFDILNPLLPDIETSVTIRADIHLITNIPNCESPCALDQRSDLASGYPLSISLDDGIPADHDIDDEYDPYIDPYLHNGNIAYFIAHARAEFQGRPQGSRLIGRIGRVFSHDNYPLNAYIVSTNWVPISLKYMNEGNYDWDASIYGSRIKINFSEVDLISASSVQGETTTSQNGYTFNVGLNGKVGVKFGDTLVEASPNVGYSFSNQETKSATIQYTLTSERIAPLGDVVMTYCDQPEGNCQYPGYNAAPWAAPNPGASGSDQFSYGWSTVPSPDPFRNGSDPSLQCRTVETGQIEFINVIK